MGGGYCGGGVLFVDLVELDCGVVVDDCFVGVGGGVMLFVCIIVILDFLIGLGEFCFGGDCVVY